MARGVKWNVAFAFVPTCHMGISEIACLAFGNAEVSSIPGKGKLRRCNVAITAGPENQ